MTNIRRITPKSTFDLFQMMINDQCKEKKITWPREATQLIGHYLTVDTVTRKLNWEEEEFLYEHIPKAVVEIMFRNNAVIAGGFVCRILDAAKYSKAFAHDVDIWFLDKDNDKLNKTIEDILKHLNMPSCKITVSESVVKLLPVFFGPNHPAVLEFRPTYFESVRDLIYQFDFDYVQNAIHGTFDSENKMTLHLTQTPLSVESRATRRVNYIADRNWDPDYLLERLDKRFDKYIDIHERFHTMGDLGVRYVTADHYNEYYLGTRYQGNGDAMHVCPPYDEFVRSSNKNIIRPTSNRSRDEIQNCQAVDIPTIVKMISSMKYLPLSSVMYNLDDRNIEACKLFQEVQEKNLNVYKTRIGRTIVSDEERRILEGRHYPVIGYADNGEHWTDDYRPNGKRYKKNIRFIRLGNFDLTIPESKYVHDMHMQKIARIIPYPCFEDDDNDNDNNNNNNKRQKFD